MGSETEMPRNGGLPVVPRKKALLRQMISRREARIVPGAPNPLFARMIEDAGFDAIYVTGAGIANMNYAVPDIGLVTLPEVVRVVDAIADVVGIPLIVDADTGFGNALNVIRTVRQLEKAGAAAIQIEDQVFPKRCGHFEGKAVIPAREMVQKIKAAVDARYDSDLIIIARTDARAVEGSEAAIERANLYAEAGADMIFVEAPLGREELARVPKEIPVPTMANIVFGGKTPDLGQSALAEMGYSVVLYANAVLQAAIRASGDVLEGLRETGSLDSKSSRLAGFHERQSILRKDRWDELGDRYS